MSLRRHVWPATPTALLAVFLFAPLGTVAAQDEPAALTLTPRVHRGQAIWVTTSDGRELHGHVLSISATALDITAPAGELSMPLSDVRSIETRDSLKNGARAGAIIGGVSLGIYLGLLSHSLRCESDCGPDYSATRDTIGAVMYGIGIGAGAGVLTGSLLDYFIKGRQIVYAAGSTPSTSWEMRLAIAANTLKVFTSMRW